MIYLILLFTIFFLVLSWRRLDWAVMFLIAAMPTYLIRFNILGLPATLLEVMIWSVFLVWVITNWSRINTNLRESFKKNSQKIKIRYPFDWEIVLLLLVVFTAAAFSGFSASSLGIWKAYFFEPVMLFVVVLNVMKGEKGRNKILWALAVSALAVSLLAIYQKITGALIDNPLWAAANTRRAVSFFGYPNAVGLYLGPLVLVMMGWLCDTVKNFQFSIFNFQFSIFNFQFSIFNSKIFKIFFIGLVIVMSILSIYFAKSKGALLGVAVGLMVFGLMASKKIRWATVAVMLIIIAGIAAYQPARNLAVANITLSNLSGQIRQAGWSDTWKMLKDGRLLTGAGLANYKEAVAPYHQEGIFVKNDDPDFQRKVVFNAEYRKKVWQPLEIYLYPHNIFLNFWSELGIAGLLLFIWIILKYFYLGIHVLSLRGAIFHFVIAGSDPQSKNMNNAETWIPGQARNDRKRQSLAMTGKFINVGLICAMVVIVIHGLVDVPYFKNDLAVMFWLLVAMMSMIKLEIKYGKNNI